MAWPVVIATNGFGIPVTEATNGFGIPYEIATNGFGTPVVFTTNGMGIPIVQGGGAPVLYSANFPSGTYVRSGAPSDLASMIAVNQAGSLLADKLDGSWQTFAANTPRVTDKGLTLENTGTNYIRDSTYSGAATSGTAFGTYLTVIATNGTRLIKGKGTAHGLPYIEIQFTSTIAGNFSIRDTLLPLVAATQGDQIVSTLAFEMVAGSTANISSFGLQALGLSNTNVQTEITDTNYLSDLVLNNFVRRSSARTLNNGSTVGSRYGNGLVFTGAIDITIRFFPMQFEKGRLTPSSPILTSGAAGTRAADAPTIKLPDGTARDININFDDSSSLIVDDAPSGDYALNIATLGRPLVTSIDWRYL